MNIQVRTHIHSLTRPPSHTQILVCFCLFMHTRCFFFLHAQQLSTKKAAIRARQKPKIDDTMPLARFTPCYKKFANSKHMQLASSSPATSMFGWQRQTGRHASTKRGICIVTRLVLMSFCFALHDMMHGINKVKLFFLFFTFSFHTRARAAWRAWKICIHTHTGTRYHTTGEEQSAPGANIHWWTSHHTTP